WAIIAVASVAMAFVPARSHGAQAVLGCPGTAPAQTQFMTEVTIDVAASCTTNADCGTGWTCDANNKCTTTLGAYSIALSYDPTLLTVATVAGGSTTEFQGTPQSFTSCATANSCQTNISAFQTNANGPTGNVSVAKVTFNAVAPASPASIGLAIRNLLDTHDAAI